MISVTDRFRVWASTKPDAVAISGGGDQITYATLCAWSEAMAHRLWAGGVRAGDRVAVVLERSPMLIVALLGVLKAGAAYVPISIEDPAQRIADVMADADVRAMLVGEGNAGRLCSLGVPVLQVPERPADARPYQVADGWHPGPVGPNDLAYLMYTSGSTGRPKAVMVEHRNITNLVIEPNYVDIGPEDRILQLSPVAFDAATFEIWGALLNGSQLVLAPPGQVQADELGALLREAGITVLWLTAALFHRQIDADVQAFAGLRAVLAGGDVLSSAHVRALRSAVSGCQVINGYGPTETTTFAVCHRISPDEEVDRAVPIGVPVQNAIAHIVDDVGRAVRDGTPGELWIGGAGVSRGYWRREELTEKAFVTVSWNGVAGRFYRSGDLVRRRADGVIEFLGRIDDQFKLRGFRIEPGEVENLLTEHPQVRTAAVGIRESNGGDRRLVAWVVPARDDFDRRALRAYLRERVPEYMVPAAFVSIAELPITANGKVNREALHVPDWTSRSIYI
jgi:amino acid adenylation domain-containing protein